MLENPCPPSLSARYHPLISRSSVARLLCGFVQVTKVRVVALVGNTYMARVHLSPSGRDASAREVDIDARPSDAINLAVRFNAPMYVNKQVIAHVRLGLARPVVP